MCVLCRFSRTRGGEKLGSKVAVIADNRGQTKYIQQKDAEDAFDDNFNNKIF